MLRKKIRESLTARIFFTTALLLFGALSITFGLIAWVTPITWSAAVSDDLVRRTNALAETLSQTDFRDCGPLLDEFIRSCGADVVLTFPDGSLATTSSRLTVEQPSEEGAASVTWSAYETDEKETDAFVNVAMSQRTTISTDVQFADRDETCTLSVIPRMQAQNLAVQAMIRMAPWLFFVLLLLSLLCALIYSRSITRLILRLSAIAEKMAGLDFGWECGLQRPDEIGKLGNSLDRMSRRLSSALKELESANLRLQGEVEREREADRRRTAFFSAASHELKTPLTILKGQLAGMLEGIDVYQNRDRYLLRSLQVAGRMENLIREMLTISRMESGSVPIRQQRVDLSSLIRQQLDLDAELLDLRGQTLVSSLDPDVFVTGDPSLLGKAVENLLSNAVFYSPEGARIRVWCGIRDGSPAFFVENGGARIREDAIPHLFEAFYREENSRNRSTGGSGLGLYLVQTILERHRASCAIENTAEGVRATVLFRAAPGKTAGSPSPQR